MRLAVIGCGHVGLVAGACFAENGNEVACVDTDQAKLRVLRRGQIPVVEPGLESLVRRNRAEKRLTFTSQVASAVRHAAVAFIAVGSAEGDGSGAGDANGVLAVAAEIGRAMNGYKVVVTKSTVPVGTAARVREVIRRETTHPFSVASNPEFLAAGTAVEDFMHPDRVVIGAEDPRATQLLTELYAPFTRTGAPILVMDCASAEMSKHAASAMLASRISVMNEVARACEAHGADVEQVRRVVGADRRIGPSYLFPGAGYGGSCLSGDLQSMIHSSVEGGCGFQVLDAVERVNRAQKDRLVEKILAHFGSLSGRTIAVWGLAFKPGTDDVREAPSVAIIGRLLEAGAAVQAYDPGAGRAAKAVFGARLKVVSKSYDALVGADGLVLVTEWNEFREPDFGRMRRLMRSPVVFDGRNIYDRERMKADGFTYYGVGR
jgi:UDPglucose 6-dehydrogenase